MHASHNRLCQKESVSSTRAKLHRSSFFILSMLIFLGSASVLPGGSESESTGSSPVAYRPFDEEEIRQAVKKPLTLEDCIRIALAKNVNLNIAKSEFTKAEYTHSAQYGIFYPVLSIDGLKEKTAQDRITIGTDSVGNVQIDGNVDKQALVGSVTQLFPTGAQLTFSTDLSKDLNSPDPFDPPTKTKNRRYSVTLQQPLLQGGWPKIVRSGIETAEYDRQAQVRDLHNTELETVFLVKRAYYNVLLQRKLIEVNQAAIQRDSTLLKASESKVLAKIATRRDVLSAEIQLGQDQAKLIKSQTEYRNSLDDLKEVLGLPIDLPIEIAELELQFSVRELDEDALIQQAIQNNPGIHSAQFAVERSRLQYSVKKNALLPRLDLVASFTGSFQTETEAQQRDLNQTGWTLGFNFSYPLFDREAAANRQVARLDVAQQEDRLLILKRQIEVQVRSIIRNIRSIVEEIKMLQLSIESAKEKVDFATTMFNLGRADNFDITDAQDALLRNQTDYVGKLVDYQIQLALLESLVGQPIVQ